MADYYTNFSCILDVGTPENAARAMELIENRSNDPDSDEQPFDCFLASIQPEPDGTQIWIRDNDGNGDIDAVIEFVKLCGAELGLTGRWGFQYADTCTKPRLDAFGGGAHVLDLATGETLGWVSTDTWLAVTLDGGDGNA
jgi:hypothetical protein